MTTILISLAAAALGAAIGLWTRRRLATLSYRHADELDLPTPGRRNWLIWISAVVWGGLAACLEATNAWTLAPALLPLALVGPALAAIDLDVMRLPNPTLGPVALITLVGLASTILTQRDPSTATRGLIGGLLAGGTFWLLAAFTRDGVGFGDVKLAALIGTALGAVSLSVVWWGLAVGSVAALVATKATARRGSIPFGPWLLAGAWIALIGQALVKTIERWT